MIDIKDIKLNTSVLELGLSSKLLNRLKLNHVDNFEQLMGVDTSKWENSVSSKVVSAMRTAQARFKEQYEKLLQLQNAKETKQELCPPCVSSDPQLDGEAYSRMTNTSFAVPSTYDQRRFFVANNILNAYVLSGRLQEEEGPMPVVMREIIKVADAFMDAFDGKPYVEEEEPEEEEEIIVPIPTVVTPPAPQKTEPQKKENNKKQKNKKDKSQKQQDNQKKETQQNPEALQETIEEILEAPVSQEIPIEIIDIVDGDQGLYNTEDEEVIETFPETDVAQEAYKEAYREVPQEQEVEQEVEQESEPELVEVEEVQPTEPQAQEGVGFDAQHPNAERGQQIKIVKYLGRGKRGSKYFQQGDTLSVKRMKLDDDGVIVVSATIGGKNVCFDSKHYTWKLE